MLIWDKTDFKTKTVTRNKEGHFIIINGSIPHNDVTILNIYTPCSRAPKYIKQSLWNLRKKLTIQKQLVWDINTLPSIMDRTEREKNNKKIEKCNGGIRQLDLKYIHGMLYPATAKFTFFSSAYGIIL